MFFWEKIVLLLYKILNVYIKEARLPYFIHFCNKVQIGTNRYIFGILNEQKDFALICYLPHLTTTFE
jgi:hypothetical protein